MKRDDRVGRSKAALAAAMFDLLQSEPPDRITITQVCRQADITRPTFYQHYRSVDDLMNQVVADRIQEHQDVAFAIDPDVAQGEFDKALDQLLDLIWADRKLVRAMRAGSVVTGFSYQASVDRLAERILARVDVPLTEQIRLRARFAAAGITELLANWLATDRPGELRTTYATLLQELARVTMAQPGPAQAPSASTSR